MNNVIKKVIATVCVAVVTLYTLPITAIASTESVFSKLNNKGEKYKTIVSVKENEEISQKEEEKELPIEAKITYKFNGEETTADKIVGKSGRVTINIEYINKSAKYVNVNGVNELMYTPFIVVVGTIINNENNSNIQVNNGKIIENGGKYIVCGVLLPGMQESLKINNSVANIEIPSNIEITMDTKNFEMGNVVSYASPKVLDKNINWNMFNTLFESANLLQDSSNQIEEGAKKLAEGTSQLKDGSLSLSNGIEVAYSGSKTIKAEIEKSVNSLDSSSENTLNNEMLASIGNQAKSTVNKTISEQLEIIGLNAKMQATKSLEQQLDGIGKSANMQATTAIQNQKADIASKAEQTAKVSIQAKEKDILNKIQTYVFANKSNLISDNHIANSVNNAVQNNAVQIVTNSATVGATEGAKVAANSISNIKVDAGDVNVDVSNINVKVDYESILKNNADYNKLNNEEKAIIDNVLKQASINVQKEAEAQAKNKQKFL